MKSTLEKQQPIYSSFATEAKKKTKIVWPFPQGSALSLTILFSLDAIAAAGENSREVIEKTRDNYRRLESCAANMKYTLSRCFAPAKAMDEYNGYFCRHGDNSFRNIQRADYVNLVDDGIYINIDHESRVLTLSGCISEQPFASDPLVPLKDCEHVVSTVENNHFLFALYLNKSKILPYSRIDLQVDKNYFIKSITLYYSAKMNFSKDFSNPEPDHAKMTISYLDFNTRWTDLDGHLKLGSYLVLNSSGNYEPSERYKNYTVVDMRRSAA